MRIRLFAWMAILGLAGCSTAVPPTVPTATSVASTTTPPATAGARPFASIVFGRTMRAGDGFDIVRIGADGSDDHVLVPGPHDVSRVSHDGRRLAMASFAGDRLYTTIVDVDGSHPQELHPSGTVSFGAMAWSRHDDWLAEETWDSAGIHSISLVHPDGTGFRRVTGPGVPGDFSPDDRELVISREDGLYVVELDGSGERRVGDFNGLYPGYLPDGRIYTADRGAIWLIDAATGATQRIEIPGGNPVEPRLSADGSRFVFSFDPVEADSIGIWWVDVDGANLTKVVNLPGLEEAFPDWIP
jgi:Tol biopolymer transport system component